ncbi:MAG: hypothetical protein ABI273_04500 [Lacunisphaera sp.]
MQPVASASPNHPVPAPSSRTRQRRRFLTLLALALSFVVATQPALAIQAPPAPIDVVAPGIHNYLSHVHFPAIEPHFHLLPVSIEPHFSRKDFPPARAMWSTCGWGVAYPTNFAPRITKLPADPVLVLANGYLKCKSIRSALFEPQVSVADYPAGHFGDYEYAGLLVPAWIEFSDETSLRKIFHTLTSLADGPDDIWYDYYEADDSPVKLADYRQTTTFTPELLIEFVGGTNLRVELNFTQGRMLIQVDDRWDSYHLNQHQAGLLRKIIAAGKNNPSAT